MQFERKVLIKKLENVEGLIKNIINGIEEERDKLEMKDISDLAKIVKEQILEAREYVKNAK